MKIHASRGLESAKALHELGFHPSHIIQNPALPPVLEGSNLMPIMPNDFVTFLCEEWWVGIDHVNAIWGKLAQDINAVTAVDRVGSEIGSGHFSNLLFKPLYDHDPSVLSNLNFPI